MLVLSSRGWLQLIDTGGFVNRGTADSSACSKATLYLTGLGMGWSSLFSAVLTDALCLALQANPSHLGPFAQLDLVPEEMKLHLSFGFLVAAIA